MPKFIIEPHFRLQEWVAEEKGYFRDEGLDYEFREFIRASGGAHHVTTGKTGAFQSIEKGREANVTCACHWTVNVAASRGHTKLYADAYSVAPCGIFVPAELPGEVARPTSPACRSRSATSQAATTPRCRRSSSTCPPTRSSCRSARACCSAAWKRSSTARRQRCTLFSGPYYFAEQLGFRKIIDNTFMIAAMLNGDPEPEDVRSYYPRAAAGAARHRPAARALHALLQEPNSPSASTRAWTRAAGAPASASCSSPTPRRCSSSRSPGSPSARSSRPARWARADTRTPVVTIARPVGAGRAAPNTLPLGSELL